MKSGGKGFIGMMSFFSKNIGLKQKVLKLCITNMQQMFIKYDKAISLKGVNLIHAGIEEEIYF